MGKSSTQARIHQAIDYLKSIGIIHKQQDIADALDISKSGISQMLKGIGGYSIDKTARRFARAYPRISAEWLLTGEGVMVLPDVHTQRPHYGGHVAAGAWDIEPQPVITDTWRDILDIAPDYDFTATATGDSMLPLIHSGDTLYCRRLYRGDPLRDRSIYLFATAAGTLVKQLHLPADRETTYSADIDTLTLRSLNPTYADIDVPPSDIAGIAKVVATFHPLSGDIADPAPGLRPGAPADPDDPRPAAPDDPRPAAPDDPSQNAPERRDIPSAHENP